ncbi:TonB-dependent receptor [Rheinheimera sp. A13L]|uniref:TonB-dependent receptor n=1 Tax=Rheinheimera sp. A13L TaxID=506534 RepID=UPI0002F77D1D|nr:TonB-dependent receptor [Rheinheimera sp. A13L]
MWLRPELCLAFFLLLCCYQSPMAWAAAAQQKPEQHQFYNLPAQPLSAALLQFARKVNQPLVYDPALLEGLSAPAVVGEFSATELLNQLLAQHPLEAIPRAKGWFIKTKAVAVKPEVAAPIVVTTTQAPAAPLEVIAVRSSSIGQQQDRATTLLPSAKTLKRQAMVQQDSLVGEDITHFPALNLANSLLRIPGITINREWGEGRQISLRGLSADFTRVQVNGMEALGTSSSPMDARGAVSRTRAFDFNIFASELFNQIDVKKSFSADQEEGGIAGTVDLHTAKPFDYDGAKTSISAQLGSNSNTQSTDPRFSALFSHLWSDFGALVSVTHSIRSTNEYGSNTTRWRRESGKQATDNSTTELQNLLDSGELWFPRGQRFSVWENEQNRLGVTGALQYKPNQDFSLVLDWMHGTLENQLSEHHMAVKDNNLVNSLIWRESATGDKEVVYASYQNASWRNENREDYNESVFDQISLAADWAATADLSIKAMLGNSSSDYRQPRLLKLNIEAKHKANIITDFTQDAFYGRSYSPDFDVTAIEGYRVRDLFFQSNFIYSSFDNAKLNFDYRLSDSKALLFGVHHKKFSNSGFEQEASGFPLNSATPANQGILNLTPERVQLYSGHPGQSWLQGNIAAVQSFYGLSDFVLTEADTINSSVYDLKEQTNAVYLLYQSDYQLAGSPLRSSLGLRFFDTHMSSEGYAEMQPTGIKRRYSGYLPSLDLAYEFAEDLIWRTGLSKNMTRPALSAMAFSVNVSQTSLGENDIGQISTGNPELQPYGSDNFDMALEWYFEQAGLASVAVFYKNIDHFIVTKTQQRLYSELGLPASLLPAGKTVNDIFNISSPQNSDSSSIRGFELALQRDLDFLPAPFDQLGVLANYTWADGTTLYPNVENSGEDQRKAFPGLSKQSYNLTLYYETQGWGARIATAYRDKYITGVESGSIDDDERGYHATTHLDFSAYYRLNQHIKLNLEAINLTNVRDELYSDSSNRAYNSTYSGRTYMFGVTAEF